MWLASIYIGFLGPLLSYMRVFEVEDGSYGMLSGHKAVEWTTFESVANCDRTTLYGCLSWNTWVMLR